ncbi:unnamed protein product [Tuber aestivum]|uniref:Uncharacterized protein n=1 Tax=Tuber aestivum TaxID=59557 RepID=A0A292PSM1_9PEZI|nr:unnamed protein product [Tuber aestivum]
MEMILLVGEGGAAMDPGGVDHSTADSSLPIISNFGGTIVFLLQLMMALIGAAIFLVVRSGFCGFLLKRPERLSILSFRCAIYLGF